MKRPLVAAAVAALAVLAPSLASATTPGDLARPAEAAASVPGPSAAKVRFRATLRAPKLVYADTAVKLVGTFKPAVPGQVVRFIEQTGADRYTTIARRKQSAAGTASLTLPSMSPGVHYLTVSTLTPGGETFSFPETTFVSPSTPVTDTSPTLTPGNLTATGAVGDGQSVGVAVSGDGLHLAYIDSSSNQFDPADAPAGQFHLTLRDIDTGSTHPLTSPAAGFPAGASPLQRIAVDAHGDVVAFVAEQNQNLALWAWARATGRTTKLLDLGAMSSNYPDLPPTITADGRYIAFDTFNADITGVTGRRAVIFDRTKGATIVPKLPRSFDGSATPSLSDDGRFMAFAAGYGGRGTGVFFLDRSTGKTVFVGNGFSPAISGDGAWITYSHLDQVHVVINTKTLQEIPIARSSNGGDEVSSISTDGRFVGGLTLTGAFVWDRVAAKTYLLPDPQGPGGQGIQYPVMPDDGSVLAYRNPATPGELQLWHTPVG